MTEQPENLTAKQRLLRESARLFAEKGFSGASVREICQAADTSSNMIHHYFGSKQGLYDAVLEAYSERVFEIPMRLIKTAPKSADSYATRLQVFFEESLEALIDNRDLFEIANRERLVVASFADYNQHLVDYFEAGKAHGLVRSDLDSEMVTGVFIDRLSPQIFYAERMVELQGESLIDDGPYRQRWMKANLDLILNGIMQPDTRQK